MGAGPSQSPGQTTSCKHCLPSTSTLVGAGPRARASAAATRASFPGLPSGTARSAFRLPSVPGIQDQGTGGLDLTGQQVATSPNPCVFLLRSQRVVQSEGKLPLVPPHLIFAAEGARPGASPGGRRLGTMLGSPMNGSRPAGVTQRLAIRAQHAPPCSSARPSCRQRPLLASYTQPICPPSRQQVPSQPARLCPVAASSSTAQEPSSGTFVHGWSTANLAGDLFGGVTAAVVALPLALAFGVAAGAQQHGWMAPPTKHRSSETAAAQRSTLRGSSVPWQVLGH